MSNKMPLEWHKKTLEARTNSLRRSESDLLILQNKIERDKASVYFYERQIKEAERQGKDGFDEDRFMKNMR